jgi:hypothetical protein
MMRIALSLLICSLALPLGSAAAQDTDSGQCFGFSFGAWKPALDLAAAGHAQPRSETAWPKAPGGRDWASNIVPNDTSLMLFPAWWPAGIQVSFAHRPRSPADTVDGAALALVADARVTAPRAPVRIWRVACR